MSKQYTPNCVECRMVNGTLVKCRDCREKASRKAGGNR